MSYVVESGATQRARKRRRTAITLLIVLAMLVGAFYYAAEYWKNPGRSSAAGCPTATATATGTAAPPGAPTPAAAPAPGQITVNVYNATNRAGLAGETAKEMKARGFVVGTVANDPQKKSISQPAEVRFGKNGEAAAKVILALVPGAATAGDARADASVDLVLGNGFKSLAPAPPGPTPVPGGTGIPSPTRSPC